MSRVSLLARVESSRPKLVGTYVLEPKKVRNWIIPDLEGFTVPTALHRASTNDASQLKPYVSHTANKTLCKDAIKTVQAYIEHASASGNN